MKNRGSFTDIVDLRQIVHSWTSDSVQVFIRDT